MSAPMAMRRKSDGRLMPYSRTLVEAAEPGTYAAVRLENGKWVDGEPLVAVPAAPAAASTVPATDGVAKAAPERAEMEPDTAASSARKARARVSKGAVA